MQRIDSNARPAPLSVDHALSARMEAVEAGQLEALARAVAARIPAQGAGSIAVGGGTAAFIGRDLSVSRAAGLGMSGVVEASDVETIEAFYRARETPARVLVSPFADDSLLDHLGARGFRLARLDTMLVRRLDRGEQLTLEGSVEVTVAGEERAAEWVATSLEGFGVPVMQERAAVFVAGFAVPGTTYVLASIDGVVAGAGALLVREATGYLFATSTFARHRGRGVQSALIRARLAIARDAGCDLAFSGTLPGSGSQRNLERAGFSAAYSQAVMIKRSGEG